MFIIRDDKNIFLTPEEIETVYRFRLNQYRLMDAEAHLYEFVGYNPYDGDEEGNSKAKELFHINYGFQLSEAVKEDSPHYLLDTLVLRYEHDADCNNAENDAWDSVIEQVLDEMCQTYTPEDNISVTAQPGTDKSWIRYTESNDGEPDFYRDYVDKDGNVCYSYGEECVFIPLRSGNFADGEVFLFNEMTDHNFAIPLNQFEADFGPISALAHTPEQILARVCGRPWTDVKLSFHDASHECAWAHWNGEHIILNSEGLCDPSDSPSELLEFLRRHDTTDIQFHEVTPNGEYGYTAIMTKAHFIAFLAKYKAFYCDERVHIQEHQWR